MYSRRGTYLSVGHATSRVVANLDSTALILATLYYNCNSATATAATIRSDKTSLPLVNTIKDTKEKRSNFITCASWYRKSTVLWISSKFQCAIQRLNLTHPNPVYYILNPTINKLPMNSKDGTSPGTIVHLELTIMSLKTSARLLYIVPSSQNISSSTALHSIQQVVMFWLLLPLAFC